MLLGDEFECYLEFFIIVIEFGGNRVGLEWMFIVVFLELEFLYWFEFGGGESDEYGWWMLMLWEGVFVILYVLGDCGFDEWFFEVVCVGWF